MKILGLIGLFFILSSCEATNDNSDDLGPFTSPGQIEKAQSESVEQLSPDDIKVNQSVHFVESQEILTSQGPVKTLLTEWVTQVQEKELLENLILLTNFKTLVDYTLPDEPTFQFKEVVAFERISQKTRSDIANFNLSRRLFSSNTPAAKAAEIEIFDVTFHNLQKTRVNLAPPELVANSP